MFQAIVTTKSISSAVEFSSPPKRDYSLIIALEAAEIADAPSKLVATKKLLVRRGEGVFVPFQIEWDDRDCGFSDLILTARALFHDGDDLTVGDYANFITYPIEMVREGIIIKLDCI